MAMMHAPHSLGKKLPGEREGHIFGLLTPSYGPLRFEPVFEQEAFLQLTRRCGLPSLWCCWHEGTTYDWPHSVLALPVVTVGIWQHLNTGQIPVVWDEVLRQSQDPRPLLESYRRYYWATKQLRVVYCTMKEANEYIGAFHRHSKPVTGALFAIQVVDGVGIVRGVAVVGRPIARSFDVGPQGRMKRRIAEVVRVATDTTWNVPSMLYGAARRIAKAMGFERLITYSLQSESGVSLRSAGFCCVAETGGRQWHTASRPREKQEIHGEKKYRWECELNPLFPFETISRPARLGEALPFACHHFLPQPNPRDIEHFEEFEGRLTGIEEKCRALAAFEKKEEASASAGKQEESCDHVKVL